MPIYLIAVQQAVDELLATSYDLQLTHKTFTIDPLSAGWNTPLLENHFRSGNGPLEAIEIACQQLREHKSDLIIISGEDYLKTGYTPEARRAFMEIYPGSTLLNAYTQLAEEWCLLHHIHTDDFKNLAQRLFENYSKTYSGILPDQNWFEFVTPLFRGVDCANPVIDFSGKILLARQDVALKLSIKKWVEIAGIATKQVEKKEIVHYRHLHSVFESACQQAHINFNLNQAYLEVYTCFPIVPIAFLYATGLAKSLEDAKKIIRDYPLTITGGMNLAKAPWNLPVLRTIIAMYEKLLQDDGISIAGVHGNGGLGERQGFMVLKK